MFPEMKSPKVRITVFKYVITCNDLHTISLRSKKNLMVLWHFDCII